MSFALPSLQDLSLTLGGLAGNRGSAYAGGAAAVVYNQLSGVQAKLKAKLFEAGKALGPVLGSAIPQQLAAGASVTAPNAQNQLEQKYAGVSLSQIYLYGGLALAVLLVWMLKPFSRR